MKHRDYREPSALIVFGLVSLLLFAWRWVGYQGSDDATYAFAALDWISNFPPLGDDHWSLRYPIVLLLAALFFVFGEGFFALGALNVIYYLGFLTAVYLFVRYWFSWPVALTAVTILTLLPGYLISATYVNTDTSELFFVVVSFLAFVHFRLSPENSRNISWLILSGISLGLGFLVRETTVALAIFYGLLFIVSPGMPRKYFFALATAAALTVSIELIAFYLSTGDFFYRQNISIHHDAVDRTKELATVVSKGELIDSEGVLSVNLFLDPFLMLFVSQKYGLLFILFVVAIGNFFMSSKRMNSEEASIIKLLISAALVWYAFISLAGNILYLVPRYAMVSGAFAAIVVAWFAVRMATLRDKDSLLKWALPAVVFLYVATSLLLLSLENTLPNYKAQQVARLAADSNEVVYTDRATKARTNLILRFTGMEHSVLATDPVKGSLVALDPTYAEICLRSKYCSLPENNVFQLPAPDSWELLRTLDPGRTFLGAVLEKSGLSRLLPGTIYERINRPDRTILVYRAMH